jgi:hypothetical protein
MARIKITAVLLVGCMLGTAACDAALGVGLLVASPSTWLLPAPYWADLRSGGNRQVCANNSSR